MAHIEMSTLEIAKIVKSFVEGIKNVNGTPNGISFTLTFDHGIPLIPDSIPLKLEFTGFNDGIINFEIMLDSPHALMRKAFPKLLSLIVKTIQKDTLPKGVSLNKSQLLICPSEIFADSGIEMKFTDTKVDDKKVTVDFEVK